MHARGMHTMGGHKSTDLFLTNQSREMHSSPAEKNCRNDEKKLQRRAEKNVPGRERARVYSAMMGN